MPKETYTREEAFALARKAINYVSNEQQREWGNQLSLYYRSRLWKFKGFVLNSWLESQ